MIERDKDLDFIREGTSKRKLKSKAFQKLLDVSREVEDFPSKALEEDPTLLDLGYYQYLITPDKTTWCRPKNSSWSTISEAVQKEMQE